MVLNPLLLFHPPTPTTSITTCITTVFSQTFLICVNTEFADNVRKKTFTFSMMLYDRTLSFSYTMLVEWERIP